MKKPLLILLSTTLLIHSAVAQTATSWRGPNHSGVFEGKNLLKAWPEAGPDLVWETDIIGDGFGSPAITKDRLYIMGAIEGTGFLFAFDLKGTVIWKAEYGPEWTTSYPGARACPTVVDGLIYVVSGFGNLSCFEAASGKKQWSKDLKLDFNGEYTMHGHSEAPAIDGDMVFLVPGGKEHNVVAMNRFTGDLVWSCSGVGERPGYNAPNLITLKDRHVLVTFSAYHLMGIDATTGELLWTHEQINTPPDKRAMGMGDTHSNIVYYEDGHIYYVAGDGNGAVKLNLSPDGTAITQVWRNTDFDDFMGGFVKLGDILYGGTTAKRQFIAVDATSGETLTTLRLGSGNTIAADGMIYYYGQNGTVNLIDPNKGAPEVVSSFRITKGGKEHFAQTVIDRGKLYVRHGNVLMVYDIQK
ncbi:PQQ-like beta-propeller repeat protein [bacterium]|nr:PQQ-like beta-propeller repeat protein [bacterium]